MDALISVALIVLMLGMIHLWAVLETKFHTTAKTKESKKINERFRK